MLSFRSPWLSGKTPTERFHSSSRRIIDVGITDMHFILISPAGNGFWPCSPAEMLLYMDHMV